MPTPREGETRKEFVDRCMASDEANNDYPDSDQRYAVCNSLWENRDKADLSSEDLAEDGGQLQPSGGQRKCPPGHRFDRGSGECVPTRSLALNVIKARALVSIVDGCGCHVANRAEDDQQPLSNRQSPGHPDPFLEDERDMARALDDRAGIQSRRVRDIYDEVLDDPADFDLNTFNEATRDAQEEWEGTWNDATQAAVLASVISALSSGERRISAGILRGVPSRESVIDGMVNAAKFYTNEFFNTQVLPALQAKVAEVLDATAPMGQPDISAIRAVLDRRLRSVPYWRVVANAATSRSYHYGLLKAAQFQGHRTYRFSAILDSRTSKICRELNGRTWFVADAVDLVERVAASDDPEEVKQLTPWVRFEDIEGQDNDALRALGVIVPPVHGNCRSTIVTS